MDRHGEVQAYTWFKERALRIRGQILDIVVAGDDATGGRARIRAPDGRDLVIDLPQGSAICEGDVFGPSPDGIYYRVRIETAPASRNIPAA
ncbi:MAG TPA: hypothetical protein VMT31_06260 [Methanomicrobiales archaeon]|nr:hypothetical protein [Methanomicrobiales archaeon]HVN66196.1 hypothetical protein [Methanomicrobiales archaeon]